MNHEEIQGSTGTSFDIPLGFYAPGIFAALVAHAADHRAGPRKALADVRYIEDQLHWTCCDQRQNDRIFTAEEIGVLYNLVKRVPYGEFCSAVEERYRAFTAICQVCGRAAKLPTCTT